MTTHLDETRIRLINEAIHARIGGPIRVTTLSSVVGLSRSHFSRAFRKAVGEPPHAHVFRLRIEHSMKLMRETEFPLSEIALAAGFSDQAHFSNMFRRSTGIPPSEWRLTNGVFLRARRITAARAPRETP
jgi:AraC family transcriptional regulator